MTRYCKWCGAYVGPKPDHECKVFRREPEMPAAETFPVSAADHRNTDDGMKRYREAIR